MVVTFSLALFFVVLGAGVISLVHSLTKNKLYRKVAFAVVLILPAAAFFVAYLLYCPACPYNPAAAIYETAEDGTTATWERGLPVVNRYEWGWRLHRHQISCTKPIMRISLRFTENEETVEGEK